MVNEEKKIIEEINISLSTIESLLAQVLDSISENNSIENKPSKQLNEVLSRLDEISNETLSSPPTQSQDLRKIQTQLNLLIKNHKEGMAWNKPAESLLKSSQLVATRLQTELANFNSVNTKKGKNISLSDSTRKFSYWLNTIAILTVFASVWISLWYIDYNNSNANQLIKEAKKIEKEYEQFPSPKQWNWHEKFFTHMKETHPKDTEKWINNNPYPRKTQ